MGRARKSGKRESVGTDSPSQMVRKKRRRNNHLSETTENTYVDDSYVKQHVAKIIQNIIREYGAHLRISQQDFIIHRVCEKIAKTRPKGWSLRNLNHINRNGVCKLAKKYVDHASRH